MNIFSKTFTIRASAVRGAKRAGLTDGAFGVEHTPDGWMVCEIADASPDTVIEEKAPKSAKKAPPATEAEIERYKANNSDRQGHLRASVVRKGAVSRVHDLCKDAFDPDTNKMIRTRKEILALCEHEGIAYYTARTQIQKWVKMSNVSFKA